MTSKTKRANTTGKKQHGTKAAATLIATTASAEATDTTVIVSSQTAGQAPANNPAVSRPNANSKLGIVLGLLEEPAGASLDKLVSVTGWLPHTTRAALTGLRKRGFRIELQPVADGSGSVYRARSHAA